MVILRANPQFVDIDFKILNTDPNVVKNILDRDKGEE